MLRRCARNPALATPPSPPLTNLLTSLSALQVAFLHRHPSFGFSRLPLIHSFSGSSNPNMKNSMIFCCGSVDRSNLLTPSSEAVKRTTASISSCMGRTAGSLQPMQSCWSPAPVSYHGGGGCAPDSRLRLVHTSASSFSVRFKSPSGRSCKVFIDTPQQQIAKREQPCRTALPDTLCAAFLATGDFDTFTE